MTSIICRLYHSIKLHYGIKRFLEKYFRKIKIIVDTYIVFPIMVSLQTYVFNSLIYHYGADYRWGDTKSQNLDRKTKNYGFGLLHYAFVRNLQPKRILCAGSMYGYIPYMLTRACMDNQSGHVDFVDAGFDFHDKKFKKTHYFGQGFWKKINAKKHFSYLLDNSYISTYVSTVQGFVESQNHIYDFVYLDGDHSYEGMVRDIRLLWPKLNPGGILCLHDIEFDFKKSLRDLNPEFVKKVEHVSFGVQQIWKEMGCIEYKLPILNEYSGIGYFRKPVNKNSKLPDFLL